MSLILLFPIYDVNQIINILMQHCTIDINDVFKDRK